ncbi:hypothetical protein [Tunturiibacter gelidiferens]
MKSTTKTAPKNSPVTQSELDKHAKTLPTPKQPLPDKKQVKK